MYRIAQEALSNAWYHAHASTVTVELIFAKEALELSVCDDGVGFVTSQHSRTSESGTRTEEAARWAHLGLLGMRERAALIGAQLYVVSSPGEGTIVRLRVPLFGMQAPTRLPTAG